MADAREIQTEKGISLARGPALIVGTILLVAGLYFLYKQHAFPKLGNFPDGNAPVDGKVFLGIFGANGWTGMLTAIGGGLLLFGAAQHLLAKAMSLIVGVGLGAAAIIALASGDVLGLAAANGWTEIGWGGVAAVLMFNTVIPRRRAAVVTEDVGGSERARTRAVPVAARSDTRGGDYAPTREAESTTSGAAPAAGAAATSGAAAAPGEATSEGRRPVDAREEQPPSPAETPRTGAETTTLRRDHPTGNGEPGPATSG